MGGGHAFVLRPAGGCVHAVCVCGLYPPVRSSLLCVKRCGSCPPLHVQLTWLVIHCGDRPGLLAEVANVIARHGHNITVRQIWMLVLYVSLKYSSGLAVSRPQHHGARADAPHSFFHMAAGMYALLLMLMLLRGTATTSRCVG